MDLDFITNYIKNKVPEADNESIEYVVSLITFKKFSKGDIIIEYGKYDDHTYILKSGYTANYIKLEDGNNFIRTIFKPRDEFGCLHCFVTKEKANMTYKALTDCEVFKINSAPFVLKKNLIITKLYIKILEKAYLIFEGRINDLAGLNSTERYIKLRKQIPNVDNILPQNQISDYLNITPVQLSRVRKKLFSS